MKFKALCMLLFLAGLWPAKPPADNRFYRPLETRSPDTSNGVQPSLLPPICRVVGGLGDPSGQLFLITSSLDLDGLLDLPGNPLGNCACRSGPVCSTYFRLAH